MTPGLAGLVAFVLNVTFWILMQGIQSWEVRHDRIPPKTKNFLYLEDFSTNSWGDLAGLGLVNASVAAALADRGVPLLLVIAALALGLTGTAMFYRVCTRPGHKPDAGYLPGGIITLTGKVHLVYYFCQVSCAVIGIWLLATRGPDRILVPGIIGTAVYLVAVFQDVTSGRFSSKGAL